MTWSNRRPTLLGFWSLVEGRLSIPYFVKIKQGSKIIWSEIQYINSDQKPIEEALYKEYNPFGSHSLERTKNIIE